MMLEDLLDRCLAKPGAWWDQPWEGDVVVKVANTVFAFLGSGSRSVTSVGLRCGGTRAEADSWLSQYPDDAQVMPYIGRYGWNSLRIDGDIPEEEVLAALDLSYRMAVGE